MCCRARIRRIFLYLPWDPLGAPSLDRYYFNLPSTPYRVVRAEFPSERTLSLIDRAPASNSGARPSAPLARVRYGAVSGHSRSVLTRTH